MNSLITYSNASCFSVFSHVRHFVLQQQLCDVYNLRTVGDGAGGDGESEEEEEKESEKESQVKLPEVNPSCLQERTCRFWHISMQFVSGIKGRGNKKLFYTCVICNQTNVHVSTFFEGGRRGREREEADGLGFIYILVELTMVSLVVEVCGRADSVWVG